MDVAYLLVSLPLSANAHPFLERQLHQGKIPLATFPLPDFQIRTLDSLVQVLEDLSKLDTSIAAAVAKVGDILDTVKTKGLRNVSGKPAAAAVESFRWNTTKYRLDKPIKELVDLIGGDALALDNDVRLQFQQYQTARLNFMAADRKKNGDLSVKSLHDIVQPEHFVLDSEHLTTVLVAVPKALVREFNKTYETACEFVIPRSAQLLARDDEYSLFAVLLFKKYTADFVAAAREHKWHPRTDFVYSEENMNEMRREFDASKATETKTKNDLIRLAETAYSEIFSGWLHIKAIRIYVESVLRYGLPPQFDCYALKTSFTSIDSVKKELVSKFGYLGGDGFSDKGNLQEYASLVDSDYEPFVLYRLDIV